ncbi:hypothetical protein P8T85_00005 [Corynebacterium rouxii]|uniref:Uncharacterized protein n=1 Tax=Corynebacterium rouxii TaxID=2719119 RepID=A0ABU3PIY0_9CORY|nr:hypothetical protein [Corynebacterium rouxii]MDT9409795.1 hypothetical protein [Corynebacterium rouxii]
MPVSRVVELVGPKATIEGFVSNPARRIGEVHTAGGVAKVLVEARAEYSASCLEDQCLVASWLYRDSFRMKNEDPTETVLTQSGEIFRSRETNYGGGVGLVVVMMAMGSKGVYRSLDNWVAAGYRRINWLAAQTTLIIAQISVGLCVGFYLKFIGDAPSLVFLALVSLTIGWVFLRACISKRWKQFFSVVHLFAVAALWVVLFVAGPYLLYFIAAMVVSTILSIWVIHRNVTNWEIESEKSDNMLGKFA